MNNKKIETDHDLKLIRSTVVGQISREDGSDFIAKSRREALTHGYNILHDIRRMITDASISDMYQLLRNLPEFHDPSTRRIKVALLISPETIDSKKYEFYETAALNDGLFVRLFKDEDSAIKWLV